MPDPIVCLAADLGAGSGRVVAGRFDGQSLELSEINRFPNDPVKTDTGWHWNFDALISSIEAGIAEAVRQHGDAVASIGVDTWGVDYGLLDGAGNLICPPFQYRDPRTDGMQDVADALVPSAEVYRRTGIRPAFFNTLLQLLAEKPSGRLDAAHRLLFMPDLINHHLTGRAVVERSIASTSQLLNASTRDWDRELIADLGLPDRIFGELCDAGTDLGSLRPELADRLNAPNLRVIAPGCHDTASAVAGVPSSTPNPVFLSSGTWSLLGRELDAPRVAPEFFAAGFSNEAGVNGTTRLLKNIAGMWLLQESRRAWTAAGTEYSYAELISAAESAPAFAHLIDPDHVSLRAPEHMPSAIAELAGAPALATKIGPLVRCILESLAIRYRQSTDELAHLTDQPIDTIHIVGGGSQNRMLNQFTADATGRTVIAGPVEATSAGNILLQLIALDRIDSLAAGRNLLRASFPTETFTPANTAAWTAHLADVASVPSL